VLAFGDMRPEVHVLEAPDYSEQVFFPVIRTHYNDHDDFPPYFFQFWNNRIQKKP
jgi:hypothetical protein